jgi:hypothetical protein
MYLKSTIFHYGINMRKFYDIITSIIEWTIIFVVCYLVGGWISYYILGIK